MKQAGVAGALLVLAAGAALSQEGGKRQEVRGVSPAWLMAGQTTPVILVGQDLKPAEIQFEQPGLTAKVVKVSPAMPKSDEERKRGNTIVEAEVTAPATLRPGAYRFKLVGDGVVPGTGRLVVDVPAPEIQEKEPNDTLFKPMPLPEGSVTVLGKLDNEGADVFQVNGKAGETWRFEVFARRLKADTKLEAVLRLRDPRRSPVRAAVDQGEDCAIEYRLPADGPHLLELFDGDNKSGGDLTYRLHVRRL